MLVLAEAKEGKKTGVVCRARGTIFLLNELKVYLTGESADRVFASAVTSRRAHDVSERFGENLLRIGVVCCILCETLGMSIFFCDFLYGRNI